MPSNYHQLNGIAAYSSPARLIMSSVGAATAAYHGYKRNQSVGWAIGWALLGGLAPLITNGVALAQGFGDRK